MAIYGMVSLLSAVGRCIKSSDPKIRCYDEAGGSWTYENIDSVTRKQPKCSDKGFTSENDKLLYTKNLTELGLRREKMFITTSYSENVMQ